MGEMRTSTVLDESVAAGATSATPAGGAEQEAIVVYWIMTNATNKNDIGTPEVRAIDPAGNVLHDPLTPEVISTKSLNGTVATYAARYDTRAITRVEVSVTNGAASARDTKIYVNHYWS